MALKRKLAKEDFDKLEETQKGFYKEKEGGYLLDLEGDDLEGKVASLKQSLDNAYKERDAAKKAAEAFKDVDPEKYRQLLAEADSKENDDLKSKGKIDEIIEKHNAKLAGVKKEYEDKLAAQSAELDRVVVDNGLRTVLIEAGVMPDRLDDAVDLTKRLAKRDEKGKILMHDKDGTPLDVSVDAYAKEILKEQKPWLFAASGAGGSGASNGTNGQGRGPDLSKLSATERLKIANATEATGRTG